MEFEQAGWLTRQGQDMYKEVHISAAQPASAGHRRPETASDLVARTHSYGSSLSHIHAPVDVRGKSHPAVFNPLRASRKPAGRIPVRPGTSQVIAYEYADSAYAYE